MLSTIFRDSTFDRLSREFDRFFEATSPLLATTARLLPVSAAPGASLNPARFPGLNIWRENDVITIEAELPGFRLEDLEVLVTDRDVTLRGERPAGQPQGATAIRLERAAGRFERSIRLPIEVDADRAQASLQHGVLRLTLPIADAVRPRRIEVRASGGGVPSPSSANSSVHDVVATQESSAGAPTA